MAKEVLAGPAIAALERLIRERMPELQTTLTTMQQSIQSLQDDVRRIDAKVDNLRSEMLDRFDSMLNTINEVSHRVTRLDGKLEGYTEAMGLRLQMQQNLKQPRKRRAV